MHICVKSVGLGDPKKRTGSLPGFPLRRPSVACVTSVLTTTAKISRGLWIEPWRGFSGNIAASMEDVTRRAAEVIEIDNARVTGLNGKPTAKE